MGTLFDFVRSIHRPDGVTVRRAYTIGNHFSYDQDLAEDGPNTKLGAHPARGDEPAYGGGWVWATAEEAQAFIEATSLTFPPAVYALELPNGWDEDVSLFPAPEDGVHRLLHDATILHRTDSGTAPVPDREATP